MFPQFSADGKSLVFTRKNKQTEDVYAINLATGVEKAVIGGGGDQSRPTFGVGGKIVYFTSERGLEGTWDIAVVDGIAGGGKKILAKGIRLPLRARPALSADGAWVAYVFDDPSKGDAVRLTKLDGSQSITIGTKFKACGEPALTVQNGRIILAYTALPPGDSDWRFLYATDITDKF